jgi:hypothetical protein
LGLMTETRSGLHGVSEKLKLGWRGVGPYGVIQKTSSML